MILANAMLYAKFLSTLSLRRATTAQVLRPPVKLFLSTLSLRRATDPISSTSDIYKISIHALLAESDNNEAVSITDSNISIHALLAESDP